MIVRLRRRKPSEKIAGFRSDRADHLIELSRKASRWAGDHKVALAAADPDMGQLVNRIADNWRALFAIADAAGDHMAGTGPRAREIRRHHDE